MFNNFVFLQVLISMIALVIQYIQYRLMPYLVVCNYQDRIIVQEILLTTPQWTPQTMTIKVENPTTTAMFH
ncbi:hypothetical protein BDA96_08G106200 [Sorghum bicolor]|uniref:Uncharacterized protein n=2 Tax=Sorghum bicolor TaxID=4558 RepID=A0A1B6PD26_SORBI|nr:hypothetical protein BDA96_08G106200 [Sorghum bicolor]KXG23435.1 hypothetical protein SORBI_3008G094900 [Sorghum bicolor]OQU83973.1 hypothetical protein SORBI_3005G208350 [Sorghum bicolor]